MAGPLPSVGKKKKKRKLFADDTSSSEEDEESPDTQESSSRRRETQESSATAPKKQSPPKRAAGDRGAVASPKKQSPPKRATGDRGGVASSSKKKRLVPEPAARTGWRCKHCGELHIGERAALPLCAGCWAARTEASSPDEPDPTAAPKLLVPRDSPRPETEVPELSGAARVAANKARIDDAAERGRAVVALKRATDRAERDAIAKDAALAEAAAKTALAEEAKRALSQTREELQDSHELANHLVMSENKKMTEIDESRKKIQALEDENRRLRELTAAAAPPPPPPTRPPISPGFDFGASGL